MECPECGNPDVFEDDLEPVRVCEACGWSLEDEDRDDDDIDDIGPLHDTWAEHRGER